MNAPSSRHHAILPLPDMTASLAELEAAFAALPFPPDEREGIRAGNATRLFPALVDRRSPTEAAR